MDFTSMEQQLEGSYREVFEKAQLYAVCINMETDAADEMLMDLFDVLMEASADQKPVEEIVGNDIEQFCKEYFSNYNIKERVKKLPKGLFRFFTGLLILEVIFFLFDGESIQDSKTDVFPYLTGLAAGWLVAVICDIVLKPFLFRGKKFKSGIYYAAILLIFIACVSVGVFFSGMLNIEIQSYWIIGISAAYVVGYIFIRSVFRLKKSGSIFRGKSDYEVAVKQANKKAFKECFEVSLEAEVKKQMLSKYKRWNRRLVKRGKAEMTSDEFAERIREELSNAPKVWKRMRILYAVIIILPVTVNLFIGGVLDSLILLGLLVLLEVPIYCACKKGDNRANFCRKKVLDDCKDQNLDLLSYLTE